MIFKLGNYEVNVYVIISLYNSRKQLLCILHCYVMLYVIYLFTEKKTNPLLTVAM